MNIKSNSCPFLITVKFQNLSLFFENILTNLHIFVPDAFLFIFNKQIRRQIHINIFRRHHMEDITDSTIFKQSYMLNLISSFHIFIILNKFRFLNNV
jgi:hypothetical protein